MTSVEYLAGLFDGEGSFSIQVGLRRYGAVQTGWVNPAMSVNLYYGTAVLERFVEWFGGQIYPYTRNGAPRGARWHLGQRGRLLPAVDALLPYLEIKREIAVRFREALLLMPPDGRGADRSRGGRVWRTEQVLAVAEIALSLNPPRARRSNKTAEYVNVLRSGLATESHYTSSYA
jgi:hypothetical protein